MAQDSPPLPPDDTAAAPNSVAVAPIYASLGARLVGVLVDSLVAFGLFFLLGMIIAPRFGGATATGFELNGPPALLVLVPVILLVLAYQVLFEAGLGATLGKLVAATQVQRSAGGRVDLRAALIRNLMRFIDGIAVYLVGAIAVLATKRNQRLGDLVADTVVVRRERARPLRIGALIAAFLMAVGGVAGGFALRGPIAAGGPPRYASLLLTDDQTSRIAKSEFAPDTPRIFVAFTLADVPADTDLRCVWIAESVAGVEPNSPIDEVEIRGGGAGRNEGTFSFTRPTAGWPPGRYRVELYLAGQPAETLRFQVPGPPSPAPAGSPRPAGSPSPRLTR